MSLMILRHLSRRALFRAVSGFDRKKRVISSCYVKRASVVPVAAWQNDSFTTNNQLDHPMITGVVALLLTGVAALGNIAHSDEQSHCIAKCDSEAQTSPAAQWNPPRTVSPREIRPTDQPRNVMLHRMRSVRARNLQEKYDIAWDTKLGEGAYGSVYPGRMSATGEKIALKKIAKRYTNKSAFKNETDALLRIWDNGGHPNISGLRDMYEDYSHYYLILDLVSGGEMFQHLIEFGAYSEADAARLMREVASALAFMHGVGVVHADLKPENLLLCSKKVSDGTIKIIDFGCAKVAKSPHQQEADDCNDEELTIIFSDDENDSSEVEGEVSTGTTAYWPPERFRKGETATPAMDMWSTGVILYIMLTGVHPFDPEGTCSDKEIEKRLMTGPSPPIGEYTAHLSPSAIDLIQKLMTKDPEKRLDAYSMMRHPWIRGETARTEKMEGSAEKLSKFKEMRDNVESAIFAVLVESSNLGHKISEARVQSRGNTKKSDSHIMKRAFEVFDQAGKGYVSSDDLGRVVRQVTGKEMSSAESKAMLAAVSAASDPGVHEEFNPGLSLAVFSDLFANLKYVHFPKGEMIFHAGDDADAMYFITSGKVELLTRKGQLISILRHGEFFGEGGLLESNSKCFSGAKAATPVDAIKITDQDFLRYVKASSTKGIQHSLKLKHKANLLANAKNLIRLQTNLATRTFEKGEVVYKEGEVGDSMFLVDEVDGGELDVYHDNVKVHEYKSGESFGESSLLFKRLRSSTVVCATDNCKVHVMRGADFLEVVESSPELAGSLRDMCRRRLFKKAVKKFARENQRSFTVTGLEQAFHDADVDRNGTLSLNEIRSLFRKMDPNFPEDDIVAFLNFIDVDEDGRIDFDEFKRIFRVFDEANKL